MELPVPSIAPSLDGDFRPAALAWRAFAQSIAGRPQSIRIAMEQGDGSTYVFSRAISRDDVATLTAAFAANDDSSVYAMILEPRFDVMNDPARGGSKS